MPSDTNDNQEETSCYQSENEEMTAMEPVSDIAEEIVPTESQHQHEWIPVW